MKRNRASGSGKADNPKGEGRRVRFSPLTVTPPKKSRLSDPASEESKSDLDKMVEEMAKMELDSSSEPTLGPQPSEQSHPPRPHVPSKRPKSSYSPPPYLPPKLSKYSDFSEPPQSAERSYSIRPCQSPMSPQSPQPTHRSRAPQRSEPPQPSQRSRPPQRHHPSQRSHSSESSHPSESTQPHQRSHSSQRPEPSQPSGQNPTQDATSLLTNTSEESITTCLFSTVSLSVFRGKKRIQVRALLDSSSEWNFITENCRRLLGLSLSERPSEAIGLEQAIPRVYGVTVFRFSSHFDRRQVFRVKAIVIDHICSHLHSHSVDPSVKRKLSNLNLADPNFDIPAKVDMLIGVNLFPLLLKGSPHYEIDQTCWVVRSYLGWLVFGKAPVDEGDLEMRARAFSTYMQSEPE